MSDNAEHYIQQAHQQWIAALDIVEDPIFMHDQEFRVLRCNRAYQQRAGLSFKEIIGRPYFDIFPKSHTPLHHCLHALEEPTGEANEEEVQVGDTLFRSRAYVIKDAAGHYLYSIHILEDITKQKQDAQTLQEEKIFSETLIQSLPDMFYVLDPQGQYVRWSSNTEKLLGLTTEQMAHANVFTHIHEEDRAYIAQKLQEAFTTGSATAEARLIQKEGIRPYIFSATSVQTRFGPNIIGVGLDITERKESEERQKLFRTLLDYSSDAIEVVEPVTFRFLDVNETGCRTLGYTKEEMLRLSVFDIDPELNAVRAKITDDELQKSGHISFESIHKRKDGSLFPVEVSTTLIDLDKPYILSIVRDITERKEAETSLQRANRALRTLSAGNLALVRAKSEDTLLKEVTRVIVKEGGYRLAVVNYAEKNAAKTIAPIAWSGFNGRHYWAKNLSWADSNEGQMPVGRAIRTGTTQICHDIAHDPTFQTGKEAALSRGYVSNIALPLLENGTVFGALCIYSSEANAFDTKEVQLLEELANDLAYGITHLRIQAAHEQQALILRQSLEQSIQAIAATVEARDPYTAGHQRRVGDLATAIGEKMGLNPEQIEGIHFASIIHDLGKIHIPAEILSKPSKLTDIEYMLIQTHPQEGYEILKNVKFPWPIADIILQHHEKMDGSGYPKGLKSEEILLEAKIINVADVVEAMSSHRPYRPGLGIEAALEEITRGRESIYDPAVVDACLELFREHQFAFNHESLER